MNYSDLAFHGLITEPVLDTTFEDGPTEQDEAYYTDFILSGIHDEEEEARASWAEDNFDPDYEGDLDFQFETDSALTSAGWGTDEDYGYYGGDDY